MHLWVVVRLDVELYMCTAFCMLHQRYNSDRVAIHEFVCLRAKSTCMPSFIRADVSTTTNELNSCFQYVEVTTM